MTSGPFGRLGDVLGDGLWGYAEADPVVVGIVVAVVVALALVYVIVRLAGNRGPGRAGRDGD